MLNQTVGSTHFKLKLNDLSMEGMEIILSGPDYVYVGPKMELNESVTRHITALALFSTWSLSIWAK